MKDIVKLGGILMFTTALAAAALAAVFSVTKPRIDEQKRLALENALTIAIPGAEKSAIFPEMDNENVLYYKGYKSADSSELVGYAYVAYGPGYSSIIESMIGVDTTGAIIGMKVLSQVETPGLGTKIEEIKYGESEPWFQKQFIGKIASTLAVTNDGGEINSITGATISSRAVANSVVKGYDDLTKKMNENK